MHGITWEIARGEQWLIEGPNGSGKSTLARLVAGEIAPAVGAHVERFGERGPFNVWELKRRIAPLSDALQQGYDFEVSVRATIASGFWSSVGLFHEPDAAQWAAVDATIERLGLEPLAHRIFQRLSFGERRKVLIGRALVCMPDIIILDEVFNGLDAAFRRRFNDLLDRFTAAGGTCIVIAHHQEDVPAFVTHRLSLRAGRIVSLGEAVLPMDLGHE